MENKRFSDVDREFHAGIDSILEMGVTPRELIHHFTCFTGYVNLARYLFFYELYKQTIGLCGHIADIGTWKGASFFFFVKMVKLFEPYSQTMVHGFDWFKGMEPEQGQDNMAFQGTYAADYETVLKLLEVQRLADIGHVHKLDLVTELEGFFADNRHMRFKLVFLDCGTRRVLESCLAHFWPRIVPGGVLILDHYNNASSPAESEALERCVGQIEIKQMPFVRQPTAYVVKPANRAA